MELITIILCLFLALIAERRGGFLRNPFTAVNDVSQLAVNEFLRGTT